MDTLLLDIEELEGIVAPCSEHLSNQQNFFYGLGLVGAFSVGFAIGFAFT